MAFVYMSRNVKSDTGVIVSEQKVLAIWTKKKSFVGWDHVFSRRLDTEASKYINYP